MTEANAEKLTREQAEAIILPGQILRLSVMFPHEFTPNDKYFVVVGFDYRPLLLKINSEKRKPRTNRKLRECQFRLRSAQYKFLEYDSYLDCGNVWYMLTKDDIVDQLIADPTRAIRKISKEHENEIYRQINLAANVSSVHRRIISEAFRASERPDGYA
jgi:hypothetical protein